MHLGSNHYVSATGLGIPSCWGNGNNYFFLTKFPSSLYTHRRLSVERSLMNKHVFPLRGELHVSMVTRDQKTCVARNVCSEKTFFFPWGRRDDNNCLFFFFEWLWMVFCCRIISGRLLIFPANLKAVQPSASRDSDHSHGSMPGILPDHPRIQYLTTTLEDDIRVIKR